MAQNKQALVVGGLGVVGRTLLRHLAEVPGLGCHWTVTAESRF